jgi:hypothetical protein
VRFIIRDAPASDTASLAKDAHAIEHDSSRGKGCDCAFANGSREQADNGKRTQKIPNVNPNLGLLCGDLWRRRERKREGERKKKRGEERRKRGGKRKMSAVI